MLQIKPHNLIFITAILLIGVLPVKGQKKFSFFAL